MVMAAGLGTRLRPLTYEVPKPMVPVANRPVIEHLLRLLASHGITEIVCNLHWFPEVIRDALGDGSAFGVELSWEFEPELLGTAGGVRNVREFFGDEPFVVMAGDALTDVDVGALVAAHEANDGIATLVAKRVTNTSEYGVIVTDPDARVQGFQEKPDPAEALSDRANSMIYAFDPEIFDYFPDKPVVDFALDVFPALLDGDVPFHVHETSGYWNDVGSVSEYLQGNLDAVTGTVAVKAAGEIVDGSADETEPDEQDGGWQASGRVLVGEGAELAAGATVTGPAVIGPGARVGEGAQVKGSVLLPGAEVPPESFLVGSITGHRGELAPS
jgi:mannose-1-phosphate guanylyltransferase/mannose-1-phosphate guanylyltransferase/phosphomannomutase